MTLYEAVLLVHILAAMVWVGGGIVLAIMVGLNDAWTIHPLWIVLALVLFGVSFAVRAAYFGPESKRIAAAVVAGGPAAPEVQQRIRRMSLVGSLDPLLLIVIVWDMVAKPAI